MQGAPRKSNRSVSTCVAFNIYFPTNILFFPYRISPNFDGIVPKYGIFFLISDYNPDILWVLMNIFQNILFFASWVSPYFLSSCLFAAYCLWYPIRIRIFHGFYWIFFEIFYFFPWKSVHFLVSSFLYNIIWNVLPDILQKFGIFEKIIISDKRSDKISESGSDLRVSES